MASLHRRSRRSTSKHCDNDACPDLARRGFHPEFGDGVAVCPTCKTDLRPGGVPDEGPAFLWRDMVPVASFVHVPEAHVARARLEAAGIPASVENEHLASIQWELTSALGGVRVCVPRERAGEAAAIVSRDESDSFEPDEIAAGDDGPRCPRCNAGLGQPSHAGLRARALSLLIGFPLLFWNRSVVCDACGHRWRPG